MCPGENRTVSVEQCVTCPHCEHLDAGGGQGRPWVVCALRTAAGACTVGRALSRFSICVRVDAVEQLRVNPPPAAWLPLVDERMQLVGIVRAGPRTSVEDSAGELAIEEQAPVHDALAHMARKRTRHLPVVARDRALVGVIEDRTRCVAFTGRPGASRVCSYVPTQRVVQRTSHPCFASRMTDGQ